MDRCWLLTWTTYGSWLPGDPRGSVTSVREGEGPRSEHDQPGSEIDGYMPGLFFSSMSNMKGDVVLLSEKHAEQLLLQFHETAKFRGWKLLAVAIMRNHVHLVVGVSCDPPSEYLVRDFKSYGSRKLNAKWGKPKSETWWSGGGGSRRKLPADEAIVQALRYVRNQAGALVIWIDNEVYDALLRGLTPPGSPSASAGENT